jgi:hypothetical protein
MGRASTKVLRSVIPGGMNILFYGLEVVVGVPTFPPDVAADILSPWTISRGQVAVLNS